MPCEPIQQTAEEKARRRRDTALALQELETGLKTKRIQAVKDPQGRVTFKGWSQESRRGLCDACTYRLLVQTKSRALQTALTDRQTQTTAR